MGAKVTNWNGKLVIVIDTVEPEPDKQEPNLGWTKRLQKMLVALLIVAPVVSLVAYAAELSVGSIPIMIFVGLLYATYGIGSDRLSTIIFAGIIGGIITIVFSLLWEPFVDFHIDLFASYRNTFDAITHMTAFLEGQDSQILYVLAEIIVIGLPFGLGWGAFMGIISAFAATLGLKLGEELRSKMFRGWRHDIATYYALCILIGVYVAVYLRLEYGSFWSVCLGASLGALIGAYAVAPIGGYCGANLRHTLGTGLNEFAARVLPRASRAWQPLIGFAVGYISIVVLFASCYAAAYRMDPDPSAQFTRDLSEVQQFLQGLNYPVSRNDMIEQAEQEGSVQTLRAPLQHLPSRTYETSAAARRALSEEKDLHYVNFLYFSVMTITSLGYSNVEPTSPFTQNLAAVEGILAFVWTAVVFAFLILDLELFYAQETGRRQLRRERAATPQGVASLINKALDEK